MNERRKGWRRTGARLYIAVWQLLRGGAAILLLVLFAPLLIAGYYGIFNTENTKDTAEVSQEVDPRMVCGTLSNTIIEVPREYIVFWPEYEGKSSWEKGFTSNNKGCSAKLLALQMAASWPEFKPMRPSEYFVSGSSFSGVKVSISPIFREGDDMKYWLDALLKPSRFSMSSDHNKYYDESLGLFFLDSNDGAIPEIINRYYWAENNGMIPVVFECYRSRKSNGFYSCSGYFIFKEFDCFVRLDFSPEKLVYWQKIITKTKSFLFSKTKKRNFNMPQELTAVDLEHVK